MSTKTIYTAEPQKFSFRIWNELIFLLAFCVIAMSIIAVWTQSIGAVVWLSLGIVFGILFSYIGQYRYRFIQAISITEEDGEFVFELLYKDELYAHVIKKNNISTKLDTVAWEKAVIYKLIIFDREKEVFTLYSGSSIMKKADIKKIKTALDN